MREGRKKQFRSNTVEARTPYDCLPRCEMAEAALRVFILPTAGLVNALLRQLLSAEVAHDHSYETRDDCACFFYSLLM